MSNFDYNIFEVDAIVEISHMQHKGIWKMTNVERLTIEDVVVYRVELDQNTDVPGDEIIMEYDLSEARMAYMFTPFQKFEKSQADSWPPPETITHNDEIYNAYSYSEEGLLFEKGDEEIRHWEYEKEDGSSFLQIYLREDGFITMYEGYGLNTDFISIY